MRVLLENSKQEAHNVGVQVGVDDNAEGLEHLPQCYISTVDYSVAAQPPAAAALKRRLAKARVRCCH
jgi:hypothetical protein